MKTAIFAIALILSNTASAWKLTHSHKDWLWGSEINDHGAFVATTISKEDPNSSFAVIARPEGGKCDLLYVWTSATEAEGWKPTVIDEVPLEFQIDSKTNWTAGGRVVISVEDDTANIYTYIAPDSRGMSVAELVKGKKLKSKYTGEKNMPKYSYSLMGSKAAMTAIWARCKDYATAYPEFNPLKQDSETVSKDSEKASQDQKTASKDPEIVSKEFQPVGGAPQYSL